MASDTPRDIKLDASGDFDVSTGDLQILTGNEAITQSARIHFQFFQGEWFLDLDAGIPYYQQLLGKIKDAGIIKPIFRDALLAVKGIESINSLDLLHDRVARTLSVQWSANDDPALLDVQTKVA